jgi:arylsulfatase A-like enzyme
MRAIVVMFDSLNRHYLPVYNPGCGIIAPNFERLSKRAVTFDNCYAGSMPCMPARREMHTGRYNFLHRSWGPLEPFDDSVPAMLTGAGVTTHLATDHQHYWEDGGATYHYRYGTFEFIRGQEGDPWKGRVTKPDVGDDLKIMRHPLFYQDRVNREHLDGLADHPQTRTFDSGLQFVEENAGDQNWFVQIETFDPHEPFFSDPSFLDLYGGVDASVPSYDWPDYTQVTEDAAVSDNVRTYYSALVTMCDASLGRVLDAMDRHALWDDTALIVCTDHGFLLGEQGWWGKGVMPWFDETIHTPLFVWDPRAEVSDTRRDALVQTIDIGPTLLDVFDVAATPDMHGRSLRATVESDARPREYGLFGAFGGHVSVTDGRHVYMRASVDAGNQPLYEHTLMPTHMRGRFTPAELADAELHPGFSFTKGAPVLRTQGRTVGGSYEFGTLLFDLERDPDQRDPLVDDELELRMATALVATLRENDAPPSQFERLGLPVSGPVGAEHLLCAAQRGQVESSRRPVPPIESFPDTAFGVRTPVRDLLADPAARAILARHTGRPLDGPMALWCADTSLYRAARLLLGAVPWDRLRRVADELAALAPSA